MEDEQRGCIEKMVRPWGVQHRYTLNEASTVGVLTVEPGQRLSLQSHERRSELWIALDDGAIVEIDGVVSHPKAGDEIWIPVGAQHRLSASERPVRVLEIAFGDYSQIDIRRFADDYGRPDEGE